eukprot:6540498-Alexandrium_andersonii.AAC.1
MQVARRRQVAPWWRAAGARPQATGRPGSPASCGCTTTGDAPTGARPGTRLARAPGAAARAGRAPVTERC